MTKLPINVEIGVGAKAEIKAEVPASSAGRFLDTLTDLIRPFSEKRGLRADQIRLQREDVLIEIARKAMARLAIENAEPKPLPNKFLVPFLEAASLEDLRDVNLTEMWANLLANASTNSESTNPAFINILKEITSEEALLFEYIFTHYESKGKENRSHWHFEDADGSLRPSYLFLFIQRQLLKMEPETWAIKILKHFDCPGVHVRALSVLHGEHRRYPLEEVDTFYDRNRPVKEFSELSFDLLVRVGLLSKIDIEELWVNTSYAVELTAYAATTVGIEFFKAVASRQALEAAVNRSKESSVPKSEPGS
jgi:hypothetical protein